jgi:glycosyltransferase involved in cell wall biosynthesis
MDIKNLIARSNGGQSAQTQQKSDTVKDLIRQADQHRDGRQYKEAALLYREYLTHKPDNFDIWVQLGNMLKDSDQLDEAEQAYKAAIDLKSDDYDIFLQLGHLLKLQGRRRDALEMYRRSFKIKPTMDAAKEISLIEPKASEVQALLVDSTTVNYFFEIDDMLNYLTAHPTPSGIQRVQAELIRFFAEGDRNSRTAHFVIRNTSGNETKLKKLRASDLLELIELISSDTSDHDRIRGLIGRAIGNGVLVSPKERDIYLIVGAFWGYGSVVTRYKKLKKLGVIIGVYIYDIIPMSHPSYCDERLAHDFLISLGDGLAIFDFIFTISEFTATEVRKLIARNGCRHIPVEPVLLAHILDSTKLKAPSPADDKDKWTDAISELKGRDYVLFVSTIEARKNHELVMRVWEEMMRGEKAVPHLVFVGRKGWRVDPLFEAIDASDYLGGHLHILHDLSDSEISTVYENCVFTVFPSFVEGWGLPVGESLVAGRPCAASNTSSVPEVGGDFVDYFSPTNFSEAYEAISKLCFDRSYRLKREANIKEHFVPRTWDEVGQDLQRKLSAISLETSPDGGDLSVSVVRMRPKLEEATFFKPGSLGFGARLREDYCKNPMRLGLSEGWYAAELFGCWMKGKHAGLEFQTELSPGEHVLVVARIESAPDSDECRLSMRVGESNGTREDVATLISTKPLGGRFNMIAHGVVDDLGGLFVSFKLKGDLPAPIDDDTRSLAAGLISFAYTRASSVESRLTLLETMLFDT